MHQEIPASQVRQNFSSLLKRLQKNPDLTIQITLNGLPVGELHAPKRLRPKMNIGESLLRLAKKVGKPTVASPQKKSVAKNHDDYLYPKPKSS